MRKSPKEYVRKRYGIGVDQLRTVYVKTTKKSNYSGPSWSHYDFDEITYAIVQDRKDPRHIFEVEDVYVDRAYNIYNVEVNEKRVTEEELKGMMEG